MTHITSYDLEENQSTGEIYMCDSFAKKLYGGNVEDDIDLDKPTPHYDKYGLLL